MISFSLVLSLSRLHLVLGTLQWLKIMARHNFYVICLHGVCAIFCDLFAMTCQFDWSPAPEHGCETVKEINRRSNEPILSCTLSMHHAGHRYGQNEHSPPHCSQDAEPAEGHRGNTVYKYNSEGFKTKREFSRSGVFGNIHGFYI